MLIMQELRKVARSLPRKAPPIPLLLPEVGQVGHVSGANGVYLNSSIRRHVHNMLKDHYRVEHLAREVSRGRLDASHLLEVARLGTDSRDAIKVIKSMRGAISSWDGVIAARAAGQYWDIVGSKASQTTVANTWSSFMRAAGVPGAMTYGAIPGPAALDSDTAGAWPLPMSLGGSDDLYLTNFGQNHGSGSNITMLVDLVQAAGSISATSATTQSIATTNNLRWTGGEGLMMTLEITTNLGATASTVLLSYLDQGGTQSATAAIALTTSGISGRLQPVQDGPLIRLAAGDYGVRQILSADLSASMAAGVLAALLYKPLVLIPTLSTVSFAERSTPSQIGGIKKLTAVAGASKACLGFLILTSGTSTGVQIYFMETVWG